MTTLKFKYTLAAIGLIFLIVSCKKRKIRKEEKPVETDKPVITDPVKKQLIPIKFESENLSINLKYIENTAFISEVNSSNGYSVKLTYESQLPYIFKHKNNIVFEAIYFAKTTSQDIKATFFDVDGRVSSPTGSLILKRDINEQLISILASGNGPSYPYKESSWSYTIAGNLSDIVVKNGAAETTPIKYTHDQKNGIFKNVKHAQLLFLEMGYSFFCADKNNRLSYLNTDKPSENTDFNYQYNTDDYPKQLTITQSKQTFKITYAELKE
ncbi:hypothetical protein [Pedobacter steynii]